MAGQRTQYLNSADGLTAPFQDEGWQEQGQVAAALPNRVRRGRQQKEWQACEQIELDQNHKESKHIAANRYCQ